MGDIDVLTNDENQERAHGVMLQLGFECYSSSGTVREYTRDDVKVEVHSRLTSEFGKNAFADAFDNATFDGFGGTLDDSYHFAYLIAHLANHLKCAGAGIRLVLDLAIMQDRCKIDFDKVFNILKDINLESFGKVILSVCYNWFGCGKCFVKNTDKVEEYMLKYGVFGGSRDEKEFTVSRLFQCEAFENGNKKSSFALKLSLAFPPYKTLRKAPYLNFLDGRPYLLPVAWIYRFFYNLKNRRKHMLSTIKNIDDEKTTALAKEELEFFEEIGLWHS
jgi:hypothetical protein